MKGALIPPVFPGLGVRATTGRMGRSADAPSRPWMGCSTRPPNHSPEGLQ